MEEFRAKVKPTYPIADEADENDGRTRLVRIPRGADSSIFGGWGVKI
ncbi:MAG TPA: hypothetical protein VKT51_11275 [Candidatus Eremiobacteraceae bacterium]|nr:hypothetical protein [Candidatus Eremiobacteraceae bacterium]